MNFLCIRIAEGGQPNISLDKIDLEACQTLDLLLLSRYFYEEGFIPSFIEPNFSFNA
jgi:hypothetical protein